MLEWLKPQISDGNIIREIVAKSGNMGSDCTFANIYLLRNKYDIEICRYRDFVIRRYNGKGARCGYTFPIGTGDVGKALEKITEDAALRGESLRFAFVTEEQKQLLEELLPGQLCYESDLGDSDYVYLRSELAALSGKAFHKKKNHYSRFMRTYPDCEYAEIGCGNWDDARQVADIWYDERCGNNNESGDGSRNDGEGNGQAGEADDESLAMEYQAICEALDNFDELELRGGIIYVNNKPVAMTIASMTNSEVCNVHFEKVIGQYAAAGGYAAINKMFAEQLEGVTYINREEDVGIEGLRKAKMSYHPKFMIKKYGAGYVI